MGDFRGEEWLRWHICKQSKGITRIWVAGTLAGTPSGWTSGGLDLAPAQALELIIGFASLA